jgi:hypothetical protein
VEERALLRCGDLARKGEDTVHGRVGLADDEGAVDAVVEGGGEGGEGGGGGGGG